MRPKRLYALTRAFLPRQARFFSDHAERGQTCEVGLREPKDLTEHFLVVLAEGRRWRLYGERFRASTVWRRRVRLATHDRAIEHLPETALAEVRVLEQTCCGVRRRRRDAGLLQTQHQRSGVVLACVSLERGVELRATRQAIGEILKLG